MKTNKNAETNTNSTTKTKTRRKQKDSVEVNETINPPRMGQGLELRYGLGLELQLC